MDCPIAVSTPAIESVDATAYRIPTDFPEADGTLAWGATTLVLVELTAGGRTGLGYTYADISSLDFIQEHLSPVLKGGNPLNIPATFAEMNRVVRNLGRQGVTSMAISAVDTALWDLKAKLCGMPLLSLLGAARESVAAYGSGGFTSYTISQLKEQLAGWVAQGFTRVKMKVGTHPEADVDRVGAARDAIGPDCELFVDANGAYSCKQALALADGFADLRVTWFEEPVSSDDLDGLRRIRDRGPAGMEIAAGEYGYDPFYFRRMLDASAVDVLQADATRCGGVTGFLQVGALCEAFGIPLSAHCAPSLHAHLGCCLPRVRHLEYFHDHERIEHLFFDGALRPWGGMLRPDPARPGLGLEFKRKDASRYEVGLA